MATQQNKPYITDHVNDGKGNLIPRPEGQDKKPKAFEFSPMRTWTDYGAKEPTERWLLWYIYHYPYAFNSFFMADILTYNEKQSAFDSHLNTYFKAVGRLEKGKYIRRNKKNRFKLKLTLKGFGYWFINKSFSAYILF